MRKVISVNFPAKYRNLQFYTKRHNNGIVVVISSRIENYSNQKDTLIGVFIIVYYIQFFMKIN